MQAIKTSFLLAYSYCTEIVLYQQIYTGTITEMIDQTKSDVSSTQYDARKDNMTYLIVSFGTALRSSVSHLPS